MNDALPVTINLSAYRGDTWSQTFCFKFGGAPIDLTGATVTAWMRHPNSGNVSTLDVTLESAPGTITIRLPENPPTPDPYDYDIEVTGVDELVTTWVRGRLILRRDVTNELPDD